MSRANLLTGVGGGGWWSRDLQNGQTRPSKTDSVFYLPSVKVHNSIIPFGRLFMIILLYLATVFREDLFDQFCK